MGIALGEQLRASLATLRAARGALDELAASPTLAAEANAAIAGGGREAVTSLLGATSPGATKLRDAWNGADVLRRELPALAGRLDGEQRAAVTMAGAHADAAADLLDVQVFGGGVQFGARELRTTAGEQLDRAIARLDGVTIEAPRRMRAWELRWHEGR